MSGDPENEYFSDGVAEEILNVLAAVPELKVAARTSAFALKGSALSIGEIASQLGVDYVLEGSVRKAGDQVRVTAQLIQASDGFHLWSDTYDRQLTNIFAIQDEIAGNIAEVLEVRLFGKTLNYTTAQDLSPEAYEKFLKARFLMRQRNDEAMEQAIILMNEVLAEAPDFPVGLAQLAEAMSQQLDRESAEDQGKIEAIVDHALSLEPDLASAHMVNGHSAMTAKRPLEAIRHLERAIELDPSEPRPHHWLGINLSNAGYLSKARDSLETAVRLEPDHANANGYLGFVLMLLGDYDRAEFHWERQEVLGNDVGATRRVQIAAIKGNLGAARQLLDTLQLKALDAQRLSLFVDALEDESAFARYNDFIKENDFGGWHLALELMILGQYEQALDREIGRYPRHSWAERWASSRTLPVFNQKILDTNLTQVWDELGPPPACRKTADAYDCSPGMKP